ncbi:MAG: G8 domain-containing protein, partial [Bacteroidota bacterium]
MLIPSGVTVTVDGVIGNACKSIRIDGGGALSFATNANTELRTEYLVSAMQGSLTIGSAATPIGANVTARLIFEDLGGTTTNEDPERFAPGAVLMGPVTMHGAAKTNWTTLATQPSAGANALTMSSAPSGWEVGDQLVIAGTEFGNFSSDEVVTITSISGSTVNISSNLTKDHKAPSQASNLDVHVANMTRNIKISSSNASVSAKRRGHIMYMHHLNVDMRYVECINLGRTDKSQRLDDYSWDDLQEEPSYVPPRGAYTNPRGRYSVHFHRGGFDPALTPAHVEGVTVNNDPGWGFVNHSSRVDFMRNVAYEVLGGSFNTESGDETGSFIENIALRSVNPSDPLSDVRDTLALVDIREDVQDFAWQGCGFWFHSAGVTVERNVVAGATGHAYIFWPEGLIENGLGMRRGDVNLHIPDA